MPATRPIICLTEFSRSGEPSGPRKYFWATMLVAFWDQLVGELDAALLEGGLRGVADDRVALLPLDLVEGMGALGREVPLEPQPLLLGSPAGGLEGRLVDGRGVGLRHGLFSLVHYGPSLAHGRVRLGRRAG